MLAHMIAMGVFNTPPTVLAWASKDPDETLDYRWEPVLEADEVLATASVVQIAAPAGGAITIDRSDTDATGVTVWLIGGHVGQYLFRGSATTSAGRTFEEYISLTVAEKDPEEGIVSAYPITLAEAKRQLNLGATDVETDQQIMDDIGDAVGWVEQYTGHVIVARTVIQTFTGAEKLRIDAWPIRPDAAVTLSYEAGSVDPVTLPASLVTGSRPARLVPVVGTRWPTLPLGTRVTAIVRAGYEPGEPIPRNMRRAMLVMIGGYDADREGGDVFAKAEVTARRLCSAFRRRTL